MKKKIVDKGHCANDSKKIEEMLLEEKNTLDFILECSKAGIFQLNLENDRLEYHESFLGVLGLSPSEIDSDLSNFLSFLAPEDQASFKSKLKDHYSNTTQSFNKLFRFNHPDGHLLHILCRGKVTQRDSNEEPLLFVGTITDLTEQLGLERLLNRTQEVAQIGAWEYNVATEKVLWSPIVFTIHGYEPNSFAPTLEEGINFYAPEHREVISTKFKNSLSTGASWDEELRLVHRDGREVWVRAIGQCERLNGKAIRIHGTFQDIDEKKKIEIELQDSKKQMDMVLEAAGIGTWEYFPAEDRLYWDDFMFQLYGKSKKNFKGIFRCWEDCLPKEDLDKTTAIFLKSIEDKADLYNASFNIVREEGELRHLQARATIKYDTTGKPYKIIGLNWDVTNDKEFQNFLIEARDKAQEATRAKSAFLASMSHEIRTPMNGALGMLELLSETSLDEEQKDLVSTIKNCSDHLLSIVNDVLDFSKIEAGKMELEYRSFDLREVLKDVKMTFELTAKKKGVLLSLACSEEVPKIVNADQVRLKQVLTNLVSNSLKFTDSGSILIKAFIDPKLSENNESIISFSVRDTGIGIPENKLPMLFDSFSQVDNSTTRRFGGSGLGLAISKSLVESMGGSIFVNSIVSEGSEFNFFIRAKLEDRGKILQPVEEISLSFDKNISVLVAEDNLTNQKLVRKYFEKMGVSLILANDGLDALRLMSKFYFDLVFMDVQMPKMDGLTATVQIKKWLGEKAPPIVAMTANVFKEDQIKCFEAGMTDFLAKPISRKSISAVLSKYFPAESLETEIDKTMEKINMNLLDEERILFEFSEDFDIFCELVEDYKAGYQQLFDELTHAIEQKNCENVKITAHTIKGVAANFYSKDLVEHAFVLERMGEKSDLNQAQEFFEKLRKSNEAVLTELDRFIQKNSSLIDSEVA